MASEEDLIRVLKNVKVHSPVLEDEMKLRMKWGVPFFVLEGVFRVADDSIIYSLKFQRSGAEAEYDFMGFDVSYRKPINIDHKTFDGVDTLMLDKIMASIDWKAVSSGPETAPIFQWLTQLNNSGDPAATLICQQLCARYLAGTHYSTPDIEAWAEAQTIRRAFRPASFDMPTIHLAYLDVIGTREAVQSTLKASGFDFAIQTDRFLAMGKQYFTLHPSCFLPEGVLSFEIPVHEFTPGNFKATFSPHPQIEHGVFAGIDTAELERSMSAIDWMDDASHYFEESDGEPFYTKDIARILVTLDESFRLSREGIAVCDKLQVKYWVGSPDFEDQMSDSAKTLYEGIPKSIATLPYGLHVKAVGNLFLGRSVMYHEPERDITECATWIKLGATSNEGAYEPIYHRGFSFRELQELALSLPAPKELLHALVDKLAEGERVALALYSGKTLLVEADPRNKDLRLYMEDGRRLHMNLKMDPDWHNRMRFRWSPKPGGHGNKVSGG